MQVVGRHRVAGPVVEEGARQGDVGRAGWDVDPLLRGPEDAVRAAVDGYGGAALGCTVAQTALGAEAVDFVTLQGGDLPPAYQITMTFDTWWQVS